jgi:hypothetical protein
MLTVKKTTTKQVSQSFTRTVYIYIYLYFYNKYETGFKSVFVLWFSWLRKVGYQDIKSTGK